jgi:serine/threonine-protein kinase
MQGRSFAQRRTREDLLTAISYCEKAIAEDSTYALAYAGLTEAYTVLGARSYIPPLEGRKKAEEFARKALALDDHLAEAHLAISQPMLLFAPYDFASADRELTRALELSPSLAMAHNYRGMSYTRQGRWDESFDEYEKARELDPLSPVIARGVAIPTLFRRDAVRARELLKQAQELGPMFVIPFEAGVYIQNGLLDEALAELGKAQQQRKNDPVLIYSTGLVYAAQGKRTEALGIIKQLEDLSGANLNHAHWIAQIYSALNERELALTWLERGFAVGAIGDLFKGEPVWDPIRAEPRFAKLLAAMNVP